MNILQGKCFCHALLRVKAYRNSLNGSNIVHRAFLIKIGQGNVTARFINRNGRNGRWNFLDQMCIRDSYYIEDYDEIFDKK